MIRNSIVVATLLLLFVLAVPAVSQQFQNKAEYDAYMALYNEQDSAIKVELGEDFVSTYPESEATPIAYQLLAGTHYAARDWRSIVDVAKRFDRNSPDATAETKSYIYTRAMAAAAQERSPLDVIDFGDKILALDRNNLGALLTLPRVILDNVPEFGSARESNLARAFELANRARIRAQDAYPIATTDAQPQMLRDQAFTTIYLSLGQVHDLRGDYQRAVTEYGRILDYDQANSEAYLLLGLATLQQAAAESVLLTQAIGAAATDLGTADEQGEASPPAELDPESAALQETVLQNLESGISYLASAAALGGQAANLARPELERIYTGRDPVQWELSCDTRPDGFICTSAFVDPSGDKMEEVLDQLIASKRPEPTAIQ